MGRAVTCGSAAEGARSSPWTSTQARLDEDEPPGSRATTGRSRFARPISPIPTPASAVAGAASQQFGRLDVLGNVAGIYLAEHMTKVTREQYRRVMAVNLDAYFFLAQAAIPHLLETRRQHRQHRLERRAAGGAVLGGVLHEQGRRRPADAVPRGRVPQAPLRVNAIAPAGTNTNIAAVGAVPRRHGRRPGPPDGRPPWHGRTRRGRRRSSPSSPPRRRAPSPAAIYTIDNGLTAS